MDISLGNCGINSFLPEEAAYKKEIYPEYIQLIDRSDVKRKRYDHPYIETRVSINYVIYINTIIARGAFIIDVGAQSKEGLGAYFIFLI